MWTFLGILVFAAFLTWGLIVSIRGQGWAETKDLLFFLAKVIAFIVGLIGGCAVFLVLLTMVWNNVSPAEAWQILGSG